MKRLLPRLGTVLMGLLAIASYARADYMNWDYTVSILNSNGTPLTGGISVASSSPNGGASVALGSPLTPGTVGSAGSSIPVVNYQTSTSVTTPIYFGSSVNTPSTYTLALQITDKASGDSGTLDFKGSLAGPLTYNTSGVIGSFVPTSSSLSLDGYKYTVTIPSATLAAPGGAQNISALVSVSPGSGGSPPGGGTGTPEPASLLLGSLGFSFVGVGCWWKRRSDLRRQPSQG